MKTFKCHYRPMTIVLKCLFADDYTIDEINLFVEQNWGHFDSFTIFKYFVSIGSNFASLNSALEDTMCAWKQYCIQNPIWSRIEQTEYIIYYGVMYAFEIAFYSSDVYITLDSIQCNDQEMTTTLCVNDDLFLLLQEYLQEPCVKM
jgi:hypothetical protein